MTNIKVKKEDYPKTLLYLENKYGKLQTERDIKLFSEIMHADLEHIEWLYRKMLYFGLYNTEE